MSKMKKLFIPPSVDFIDFIVRELQTSPEILDKILHEALSGLVLCLYSYSNIS